MLSTLNLLVNFLVTFGLQIVAERCAPYKKSDRDRCSFKNLFIYLFFFFFLKSMSMCCHHHVPRFVCLRYLFSYRIPATGNQTTPSLPIVDITVEAKPDKRVSGGSLIYRTIVKQIPLPSQWSKGESIAVLWKPRNASWKQVRRRASQTTYPV